MREALLLFVVGCLVAGLSCSTPLEPSPHPNQYALQLVSTNDTADHRASFVVDTTQLDQILITITGSLARNGQKQLLLLRRQRDAFYERKYFPDEESPRSDSLDLLALALYDTTYTYLFDSQRFMPLAPFGSEDYKQSIVAVANNLWRLRRCNVHDTSYCMLLTYDHHYQIRSAEFLIGDRRYLFEY